MVVGRRSQVSGFILVVLGLLSAAVAGAQTTTLTAERLRTLLSYTPETGEFVWRVDVGRHGRIKAGTIAGCLDGDGYLVIRIGGKLHRAHRLAVLHVTGEWPPAQVDHRFGIRHDNRWSELRDATSTINNQNRAAQSRNATGFLGVEFDRRSGRYAARIMVERKRRNCGTFDTAEEAHAAYVAAKMDLHAGCVAERMGTLQ